MTGGRDEPMAGRTGLTPVKMAILLTLAGFVALVWFAPRHTSREDAAEVGAARIADPARADQAKDGIARDYPLLMTPRARDEGVLEELPIDPPGPGETAGPPGL